MKEVFLTNGIPTARFKAIENNGNDAFSHHLSYPVVVKPADSNGSFGVRKVNCVEELKPAVAQALRISRSRKIVIEEYVDGVELSIDAFVSDQQVNLLLVTETRKIPSTPDAFPICQSHYPACLNRETLLKIEEILYSIVAAFELNNTPLLVQLVVRDSEIFILEFGARIAGGSKHHLIRHVTGFDVMEAFVETLFQGSVEVKPHPCYKHVVANYVYAHPGMFSSVAGVDSLLRNNIIVNFYQYKTSGMEVAGSFASRDRIGAFIAEANNRAELEQKLEHIDKKLQILDQSGNDMMLHGLFL